MFRTGSPYSPFFTSGLLSEHTHYSPCSSRSPSPAPSPGPRRGSLPTDSTSVRTPSSTDGSSAFYFTLQPKRDTSEYRSFLSLDLAESASLRSASLKRKSSCKTRACSRTEKSFTKFAQIPEVHNKQLAPPRTSLRLRLSRDSLRTIPSPKPAPSITLPDLPKHAAVPPSPSLSSTAPRLPSIAVNSSLGLSLQRASQSTPSLVIARTTAPKDIVQLPNRSSISTVSSSVRKVNRSHALARLEGRTNSTRRKAMAKPFARNFMSMSDDEDDGGDDSEFEEDSGKVTLSAILEPEDIVFPPPSPSRATGAKSAPIGGRFPSSPSSTPSCRRKQTRSTDWNPLKSFIDLQGEDDMSRWSWRSFIEVASVS
ncbi:hypothetical protein LshimejAT787_1003670 [Lyophyllum shimeji]|uniref:Uncharacterized protein n=1 Tax=Lyophyllum shimeji TaxID=47721 RepID=A0A9P3PS53_LYOSH|nr:hypothetical protein LshimejAT787_1003670 [Lyophyllum shimeji]